MIVTVPSLRTEIDEITLDRLISSSHTLQMQRINSWALDFIDTAEDLLLSRLFIGGDSFGANANFGTTDAFSLNFKTDDAVRLAIAATGAITFNQAYTFPTADGSANQILITDGFGALTFQTPAGAGEINTASNQGTGGVGLFNTKNGVDLEFRNINAASNKVSVTLDGGNKEVDLDVVEANIIHQNISGAGTNTHA